LEEELSSLRRVADAGRTLANHWQAIDPLDGLLRNQSPATLTHAWMRLKHSERSRHYRITQDRHVARFAATTLEGMLAAEVPSSHGRPQWQLGHREAVNLRSLRKHGTIEFRCFAAPRNADEIVSVLLWVRMWLACALDGSTPSYTSSDPWPQQAAYNHELETGWRWTNFQHNQRAIVAERLRTWSSYAPGTSLVAPR
jgi:hypothetical protein